MVLSWCFRGTFMGFSLRFHDVWGLSWCFIKVVSLCFRGLSIDFHGALMDFDEKTRLLLCPFRGTSTYKSMDVS